MPNITTKETIHGIRQSKKLGLQDSPFLRTSRNKFPAHSLRRQGQEASFLNCYLLAGNFNHLPEGRDEEEWLTRGGNKVGDIGNETPWKDLR
jgi:hypothetical protein